MRGLLMDSTPVRQPRPRFPARPAALRLPAALEAALRAVLGAAREALAALAGALRATTLGFGTLAPLPAGLAFLAAGSVTFLGLAGLAGSALSARSIALATSGIAAMPSTDFRFPCQR